MVAQNLKRSCLYCGLPTKKGKKGEHIVPEAIDGRLTLNDISNRAVCAKCNSGFLSYLDKELCSRSYLSIVASQKIAAHLWQTWDIDHAANNLLVEARPLWSDDETLSGLVCYPQITFERPERSDVRADFEECRRFGTEHFAPVLFKAVRQCFQRYSAGKRGAIHFERIQSGVIYDECRLAPRIFTRHSIGEIAQRINDQSFILRFTNEDDKKFALQRLSKLDDGRHLKGYSRKPGSHTPTLCCFFDAGDVLRALMKIGLNLIAAYCSRTPVNCRTFAHAIRVIRGEVQITHAMIQANGFVHARDIQGIKGSPNEHSFRLIHVDRVWHIYSSFFGGNIGAYVQLPGPNHEEWNSADVVAPMKSKTWTFTTSRILPIMTTHVEWRNSEKVTPSVKMQKSVSILRAEITRRK